MHPLNIAVYLAAVLHAMSVGPQLAAALGQHERISSRAAAVDSQVSTADTVDPSESRLFKFRDLSALTIFDHDSYIVFSAADRELVQNLVQQLKSHGTVDVKSLPKPLPRPVHFLEALGLPREALKGTFGGLDAAREKDFWLNLLGVHDGLNQLGRLRKYEEAYEKHVAESKATVEESLEPIGNLAALVKAYLSRLLSL